MPSILYNDYCNAKSVIVLNLIITGMPSILKKGMLEVKMLDSSSFKPYYNWNAFNTDFLSNIENEKLVF